MLPAASSARSTELKAFPLDCRLDNNLAYQYNNLAYQSGRIQPRHAQYRGIYWRRDLRRGAAAADGIRPARTAPRHYPRAMAGIDPPAPAAGRIALRTR